MMRITQYLWIDSIKIFVASHRHYDSKKSSTYKEDGTPFEIKYAKGRAEGVYISVIHIFAFNL